MTTMRLDDLGTSTTLESNKSLLGIGHQQITRTPPIEIPQIMERPLRLLVPIGRVTTTWARLPEVVATVGDDLGLWQVCGGGDPGAWVGAVLTWTEHRVALLAQRCGPALYAKRLRGATRCSRYSLGISHCTYGHVVRESRIHPQCALSWFSLPRAPSLVHEENR